MEDIVLKEKEFKWSKLWDYSEALKLFGFTSNFTKEELKKRYLELSKNIIQI